MDIEELRKLNKQDIEKADKQQIQLIDEIGNILMNLKVKELPAYFKVLKQDNQLKQYDKAINQTMSSFLAALIVGMVKDTDEALFIINDMKTLIQDVEKDYNKRF